MADQRHDTDSARAQELRRLGARARQLRTERGLTQQQVADQIGVARATIVRFEAGQNDIGSSRLAGLAECLGVAPTAFF